MVNDGRRVTVRPGAFFVCLDGAEREETKEKKRFPKTSKKKKKRHKGLVVL
jgi:hypothetical protein